MWYLVLAYYNIEMHSAIACGLLMCNLGLFICKFPSEVFMPYPKVGNDHQYCIVCVCVSSVKVAYSGDNSVKAVLLKDKPAKAEPAAKQQQYIEVSLVQLFR